MSSQIDCQDAGATFYFVKSCPCPKLVVANQLHGQRWWKRNSQPLNAGAENNCYDSRAAFDDEAAHLLTWAWPLDGAVFYPNPYGIIGIYHYCSAHTQQPKCSILLISPIHVQC
jgi:hypothetical protein